MSIVLAVFFSAMLLSYSVGFGIEIILRNDIVWGRPKTVREIAIGEIPSSILIGVLTAVVVMLVRAVT